MSTYKSILNIQLIIAMVILLVNQDTYLNLFVSGEVQ